MDAPVDSLPETVRGQSSVQKFCITNASHSTRVLTGIDASAKGGDPPIVAANNVDDEAQFWEYDASLHTIKNVKTGLYAIPEELHTGARVLEGVDPFTWNVDRQSNGLFTITLPEDDNLLWTLNSGINYEFVTLQRGRIGDSASRWMWTRFQSREPRGFTSECHHVNVLDQALVPGRPNALPSRM